MGAGHQHGGAARGQNIRRLAGVLVLTAFYMVAEVIGGWLTNSLALMADAGHMFSDVAALGLSLFAIWIAQRAATSRHTYGFYRTEILAALINGATLVAISIFIFVEAYRRFAHPPEVQGGLMMAIAVGGLCINLAGLAILNSGRSESLNVRGAWLHIFTDMLGSIGVILAGALIWDFNWTLADPVVSVMISLLVIYSSWGLIKETVAVLMEGAPGHIDVDDVRRVMLDMPGVTGVHDLHVWTISSRLEALSGHVTAEQTADHRKLLNTLREVLHDRFGVDHITIQIEPADFGDCGQIDACL